MKILVTGGLGYLGGRFSELLASMPDIRVMLTTRCAGRAAPWAPAATIASLDPSDGPKLASLCRGVDVVVHLAGMNAAECQLDPAAARESRVAGVATLLGAARSQGVRRLIHVSTAHVYGAALSGTVDENTPAQPRHPYAASHLAAEGIVRAAHAANEIDGLIVRLSNSFGAPVDPAADCWTLVTNDLCRQAVRTRRMTLRTAGLQRRDFIAMSEVCRALLFLSMVSRDRTPDNTFNVGSGDAPTLRELAQRIATRVAARLGFHPDIETGTLQDAVGAGAVDFRISRLRAAGFEPDPVAATAELDRLIEFCARPAVCA